VAFASARARTRRAGPSQSHIEPERGDALELTPRMRKTRPGRLIPLESLARTGLTAEDKHGLITLFWGISAGPSNPRSGPRRSVRSAAHTPEPWMLSSHHIVRALRMGLAKA